MWIDVHISLHCQDNKENYIDYILFTLILHHTSIQFISIPNFLIHTTLIMVEI